MSEEIKISISWSIDERSLIVHDEIRNQPVVTVRFHENWPIGAKREFLVELLKALER